MDSSVLAAIAKWPNVAAVYGWLGLTARGEWRLRGESIANAAIREFIGRNYASDQRGCWYFQNGPQRVFVELESTPWVWRVAVVAGAQILQAHTGALPERLLGAWLDERGRVYLETELGCGLVDSRDVERTLGAVDTAGSALAPNESRPRLADRGPRIELEGINLGLAGRATVELLRAADIPDRFGFCRAPHAP
jgi:hypothetical protein